MAKKKTSNKKLGMLLSLIGIVLGIAAFCMLFAAAVVIKDAETAYTGANISFGYSEHIDAVIASTDVKIFNASANIVTYILVLVGIVFAVIALFGKLGKIAPLVAAAAFLVAGIFFFLPVQFCSPATSLSDDFATAYIDNFKESLSLGAGAIAGGILSILAAVSSVGALALKK